MHIVVETDRMRMRRFTEEDAQALAALYGAPRRNVVEQTMRSGHA